MPLRWKPRPKPCGLLKTLFRSWMCPRPLPKNVDMTVFLLVASDSAAAAAGAAIPKDLDSVVTQLKNTFPFKNYGLLDVSDFRTRTGQTVRATSSGGSLPIGNKPVSVITTCPSTPSACRATGARLRVDSLNAQIRVPSSVKPLGAMRSTNTSIFRCKPIWISKKAKRWWWAV